MFRVGMSEMVIIALAIVILFGPQALPEIAKTIGKFLRDLEKNFKDDHTDKKS